MDLGHPLTSLFGRLDGHVLAVLATPNTQLNGRAVHRLLGIDASIGGVHAALSRLVETGVLTALPRSTEIVYQANREHLLWPAVEIGLASEVELLDRIRKLAHAEAPGGSSVVLYGSVQRGDAHSESDVDLLVVFPTAVEQSDRDEFAWKLSSHISLWTGNDAQVIQIDTEGLRTSSRNTHDRLVQLWLSEGEVVFGPALT